jgi:hypothetical protein
MIVGNKCIIIILYIDDFMITRGGQVEKIKDLEIQLSFKFKMSSFGTMQ